MASANLDVAVKKDWALANPWLWLGIGVVLSLWALTWTLTFREIASDYRVIVLALGMLATGAGVLLRWRDRETPYLQMTLPPLALWARLIMSAILGLLAVGLTGFLVLSIIYGSHQGWYPGATFFVWLSAAPVSFLAARRCFKAEDRQQALEVDEEIGFSFIVAAAVCAVGWYALYIPTIPADWSSIRLFLRALGAVCLFASALTLVATSARRMTVSILIVLHFAAISTACLAAPPSPWLISQAWVRLSRPYLEFMYLNNAYHFYAPEPGPSSYLWFRVIYTTPEGQDHGLWYKVPGVDERGRIQHPVSLEYQRYLTMTENILPFQSPPVEQYYDPETQQWTLHPFYRNRLSLVPIANRPIIVGQKMTKHLEIPLNAHIPAAQQIWIPNDMARKLIGSFARYVAKKYEVHPEHPDWVFKSVKVYRVVHWIPPVIWFQNHIPPTDPELYRPFYAGNFRANGELIEDGDPYRYWLITSVRDNPFDPESGIRDYCRLHAGDPNWYRPRGDTEWVEFAGPIRHPEPKEPKKGP